MNWVHVHNLVQAHVLAAEALTAAKGYVAVSSPRGPRCPSLGDSWPTHVSPQLKVAGAGPGCLYRASLAPYSALGGRWC